MSKQITKKLFLCASLEKLTNIKDRLGIYVALYGQQAQVLELSATLDTAMEQIETLLNS